MFEIHNQLGRYCREKQYGDALEKLLKLHNLEFKREKTAPVELIDNKSTNKVDFIVDNKIVLELKAKSILQKNDYYQIQKYLQASGHKLGFIVNFRNKYLKPIRIIRINS
ncbi:MAG: GxxExxY protein [Candidatus Zambryskibacteria bacterium]|nr:GxxExxY protein [Candidatus Zambryskibacteria bacterium]